MSRHIKTYNSGVSEIWDSGKLLAAFRVATRDGQSYRDWVNARDLAMQKLQRIPAADIDGYIKEHPMLRSTD